ncbi:MAG: ketoacyl-ACP synthase III [Saprospiraceae bacterium]|nr:ketoacyl-ACP synthase III [Saprospiraceae bacterium]
MQNARIAGIGAYAPDRRLDNAYFDELLGEKVSSWLEENVEIFERRWCVEGQSTADLCQAAAMQALDRAGLQAEQLQLIIVATDTPEYISPSTASVVQHRIGAKNAGTFDINTACAGFVTALDTGAKYIRADKQYQHVLIIGAYAMSKYLNKADKKTVTLFADGAGAVVLSATANEEEGYLASQLLSQGQYHDYMGIYAGGTNAPVTSDVLDKHTHQLVFAKKFPKTLNPEMWSGMAQHLNQQLGVKPEAIAKYFITQININSIRATMDILGESPDKAHTVMHQYGYTGSACIPMAFNDAWEKGLVKPGDLVYFIGSGGGLAFASAAFRL